MSMSNEQKRIALAEAMGWEQIQDLDATTYPNYWIMPDGRKTVECPDPFTDANDDYAVLEWAGFTQGRGGPTPMFYLKFCEAFHRIQASENRGTIPSNIGYQIGDYARAALEVIGND